MTFTILVYDFESVEPVKMRILHEYTCQDGDEILETLYGICQSIDFDPEEFDVDITELKDTSNFTDSNFVLLDPIGEQEKAYALVGIVVARSDAAKSMMKDGYIIARSEE